MDALQPPRPLDKKTTFYLTRRIFPLSRSLLMMLKPRPFLVASFCFIHHRSFFLCLLVCMEILKSHLFPLSVVGTRAIVIFFFCCF